MGIRDKEIERMRKYAQGLGIKVVIRKGNKRCKDGGYWSSKPPMIEVLCYSNTSKTDIIVILLHELGHHLDWIYKNRKEDKNLNQALEKHWNKQKLTRKERYLIRQTEYDGIGYMSVIAHELGLKIPEYKIKAEMDLDRWTYDYFYETGKFPKIKDTKLMSASLREYYKSLEEK